MSGTRSGISRCAARKCLNNSKNCDLSFFRFPIDINRARVWVIACCREDLLVRLENLHTTSYRVCGAHFEDKMFLNNVHNRLHKGAVPRLFPSLEDSSSQFSKQHLAFNTPAEAEIISHQTVDALMLDNLSSPHISSIVPTSPFIMEEVPAVPNKEQSIIPISPSSRQTQTPHSLSMRSPRKDKLRRTIKQLTNENFRLKEKVRKLTVRNSTSDLLNNITLEDYKKLTYKFCPSQGLSDFINIQVGEGIKKPKGRRYSDAYKNFCLELYFSGPNLYKKKLVKQFCMPSVTTLRKFIRHISILPGINDLVFETLTKKVNDFNKLDKLCMLCVDEINIKPNLFYGTKSDKIIGFEDLGDGNTNFKPALAATVIMIRGIKTNWKQPVAYYFVNSTCPGKKLKDILLNVISKLNSINLKVVGVVSDMGSNNIQLAKLLNVSPETPYYFYEDQKIVFLFDTPHLLKALRNNLMKYRFVINNLIASWEFIKKIYEHDKQYPLRAAVKLTDSHISPNNFEKMKVKYATQIFSNTVAASLNLYIRFNALPPEAKTTEEFIRKINNLFDMLNSSSIVGSTKYQGAYRGTDEQKNFLSECYELFNNIQILNLKGENVTSRIKCVNGWKITISGIIHLGDILKTYGMEFLLARRLNQDCIENFFGAVRQQSGNCINPTPIQFIRIFRRSFCLDMMHSGTENCEKDEDNILLKLTDMPTEQTEHDINIMTPENVVIDGDYRKDDILQKKLPDIFAAT